MYTFTQDQNLEEELHKFRKKWRDEIQRSHRNTHISEQIYPQTSQDAGRINSQNNNYNTSLTSNQNDISYLDNNNNKESMLQAKLANINLEDSKISEKELILYKVSISIQSRLYKLAIFIAIL